MGRETSMSAEQNKAIALRASEIVNQKNPDLIEECYPPDFVWHGPDQDIRGYEQAKQMSSTFLAAFPDAQITDEDVIAEGEKVVRRYTTHATHQGETEMFGPPTGRQIELKGITIHRIEGGKIVEEWESFDNLSMMKQLGLDPEQ
jgi:predicted ester cyclase